jgi:hypothetical protein
MVFREGFDGNLRGLRRRFPHLFRHKAAVALNEKEI